MKLRSTIFAGLLLLWAMPVFSQACAMCYSNTTGASKDGQRAILRGVEVLLFPPLGVMTVGVWMAFRYARKRDREKSFPTTFEAGWRYPGPQRPAADPAGFASQLVGVPHE